MDRNSMRGLGALEDEIAKPANAMHSPSFDRQQTARRECWRPLVNLRR